MVIKRVQNTHICYKTNLLLIFFLENLPYPFQQHPNISNRTTMTTVPIETMHREENCATQPSFCALNIDR